MLSALRRQLLPPRAGPLPADGGGKSCCRSALCEVPAVYQHNHNTIDQTQYAAASLLLPPLLPLLLLLLPAKGGEFGLEGITLIEGMTPLEGATDVEEPEGAALPGQPTGTSAHAPITGKVKETEPCNNG